MQVQVGTKKWCQCVTWDGPAASKRPASEIIHTRRNSVACTYNCACACANVLCVYGNSYLYPYRYCIFSLLNHLLRIKLRQNPLLSYLWERERERERLHCKCTMWCTVHFIITLFNVYNVLLCVICQLNFTVFMHVTRISRYTMLYIVFSIMRGFP